MLEQLNKNDAYLQGENRLGGVNQQVRQEMENKVARVAGLIDGDGSICLVKANKGSSLAPVVSFYNTDKALVSNFRDLAQEIGCSAYVSEKSKTLGSLPKFGALVFGFKRVKKLLASIEGSLNDKRVQAELLTAFIKTRESKPHKAPYGETEYGLAEQVRLLNELGGQTNLVRTLSHEQRLSRLAALFDAEGSAILYILKPKLEVQRTSVRIRRRLTFTTTSISLRDEIVHCLMDMSIGFRVPSHQPVDRKLRFQVEICGSRDILNLLDILLPRMKGEKKRETTLLFQRFVLRRDQLRNRRLQDEDIRIYNLFRQLNKYPAKEFHPETPTTIRRARVYPMAS